MDLRCVKTFVKTAELGSFTKAAAELCYVQSTVTMQIQQLERELGFPLFDRIGKRISLTALGEEFLNYAYELLHIAGKAEAMSKSKSCERGRLRIGVPESVMFAKLLKILPQFKRDYSDVELCIKTGHTSQLLKELKQNELDIVYTSADLNTDPDICCYDCKKERIVFVCAKNHPLASKQGVGADELMSHEFLVTEREGVCYTRLKQLAARHSAVVLTSVEVDSVYVITELVKRGMGIAFLPEYAITDKLQDGGLVKIDTDIEPQEYYCQVLCHKSRWVSPAVTALIDIIKKTERYK